jgi:digeranylgeranylglycerophospholipid reductase
MIVIGAGSAGLFLAEKSSEKAIIIEEHKTPGLPIACTGILTDDINKLISSSIVNKFTVNKITNAKIYSPNNFAELKLKDNIIIDNAKFVEYLLEKAENNDAKILTNHRYLSNTGPVIKVRDLETKKIKIFRDRTLIGADGPQSRVAANNNLNMKREYLLGMQARIKIKDLEKNKIEFYPYIEEYAWSTPENEEISRVGLAVRLGQHKDKEDKTMHNTNNKKFLEFLKKYPGKRQEIQAGLIPLYRPGLQISRIEKNFSVALVGDAASQIKNTTGGGIIPGMNAALVLSNGINNYADNLTKLNRELSFHYTINRIFVNYNHKDWDRLILKVKDEKIKAALENTNRDNITKLLFSLAKIPSMISEGIIALSKLR